MRMPDVRIVLASSKRFCDLVQSKGVVHNCVCTVIGYQQREVAIHGTAINVANLLGECTSEWEKYEEDDTVYTSEGAVNREYVEDSVQVMSFLEDR